MMDIRIVWTENYTDRAEHVLQLARNLVKPALVTHAIILCGTNNILKDSP